jgi:hypothetical protein
LLVRVRPVGGELCLHTPTTQVRLGINSVYEPFPLLHVWGTQSDSSEGMAIRLYRPGWKTVELRSWDLSSTVCWVKAETLREQETAVDELLSIENVPVMKNVSWFCDSDVESLFRWGKVPPGSTSLAHRQALLFAASEYERLAEMPRDDPADPALVQRLREKAQAVRALAEK